MFSSSRLQTAGTIQAPFHHQISIDLKNNGWSAIDDYLPSPQVYELLNDLINIKNTNSLQSLNSQETNTGPTEINNFILLNSQVDPTSSQWHYIHQIEKLRYFLNREDHFDLSNMVLTAFLSSPSFYQELVDNIDQEMNKFLTVVLFLNQNWQPRNGGQLRLYLKHKFIDIEPIGGRLVTYFSNNFHHEILPFRQDHFSLSGWFNKNKITV